MRFYVILACCISLIFCMCSSDSSTESKPELIKNGSFSTNDLTDWNSYLGGSSSAVFSAADGVLKVSSISGIANPSVNSYGVWDIQLNQNGITLENGKAYRVSFDAYADEAREIKINCQESGSDINGDSNNYTSYNGSHFFTLSAGWDTYTETFYMNNPSDTNAQFSIAMGNDDASVTMDNISLKKTELSVPGAETNLVSNSGFDDMLTGWDYFLGNSAVATMQVASSELQFNVSTPGIVILIHYGIMLKNGKDYRVSLEAWAGSASYPLSVILKENGCDLNSDSDFGTQYGSGDLTINSTMTGYDFTFTMNNPTDYNSVLFITLDDSSPVSVIFDNISIIELSD